MLKSTGIVRKVDELGRVVIPKELRTALGIGEKDGLEIFVEGNRIVLQKYSPGCKLCGSLVDLRSFKGTQICRACESEIAESRGA
jgi:transcriptional pleiotropic regulator of transition state genes